MHSIVLMPQIQDKVLIQKISLRIKEIRALNGITQEQFFYDTGIHLARIESGKANISVSTMSYICKYFSISLEEFFKGL